MSVHEGRQPAVNLKESRDWVLLTPTVCAFETGSFWLGQRDQRWQARELASWPHDDLPPELAEMLAVTLLCPVSRDDVDKHEGPYGWATADYANYDGIDSPASPAGIVWVIDESVEKHVIGYIGAMP
jgi:hypothetical protein